MKRRQPQRPSPRKNATAVTTQKTKYTALADNEQLVLPEIAAAPATKKPMQYEFLDVPIAPTGHQNKFVLSKLQECAAGITTIEFAALGVADPRPRVRDLRELGWHIETVQDNPHDVGKYVLMGGCN